VAFLLKPALIKWEIINLHDLMLCLILLF
jgi:hypothetical protein